MTVREIVQTGKMRIITAPPYCERRFAICDRCHDPRQPNALFTPLAIPEEYAERHVWLGYHWEGLKPGDEHTCVLCIE